MQEVGANTQPILRFMETLNIHDLPEEVREFVEYNIDMAENGRVEEIAANIGSESFVEEVSYDKPLIAMLTDNVKNISFWILVASGVFTIIAVLLINSSIRLSIYSKRFIIKTMQMVGATKRFIRRPFIWTNIKLGMLGAFIALVALAALLYYIDLNFPDLRLLQDPVILGVLFVGVFTLGILISYISTFFATQRFLNLRTDDLYY